MHDPAQMPREALEAEVIRLRKLVGELGSDNDRLITERRGLRDSLEERTRDLEQARQEIVALRAQLERR